MHMTIKTHHKQLGRLLLPSSAAPSTSAQTKWAFLGSHPHPRISAPHASQQNLPPLNSDQWAWTCGETTHHTDGQVAVDEVGEVSAMEAEGPDGNFDVTELEILAWKRREWMQARKQEKPTIMQEICREFAKMEKHHNLRLVEWQEKEEQIAAWLKKPLRTQKPHIIIQCRDERKETLGVGQRSPSVKRGVNLSQEPRVAWWRVKEYREKTDNMP
ncbi:hypothetical protein EDC04DRAFT_2613663 [Pisolithus marmoratus]|nr:hypothetical protein EDC04DRAFT_2613663 [Pisolithus marmoratus]